MPLADGKCAPGASGATALRGDALTSRLAELPGWSVNGEHDLNRSYSFGDFKTALAFVNRVGAVAEAQGHHPDLLLVWGRVDVKIFTHSVDGLTDGDFALAAKVERLYQLPAVQIQGE